MNPSAALRSHRCFRTTADGLIPLLADWPRLFTATAAFEEVAFLTRHANARLVHRGPLPFFNWDVTAPRPFASTADGSLTLHLHAWEQATAWGRLAVCGCCGSPGRIELHQAFDGEFLHISAAADCLPADWSAILTPLVAEPFPAETSSGRLLLPAPQRVRVSAAAHTLHLGGEALVPLLSALGGNATSVTCVLRTAESTHTRAFVPQRVFVDEGVLTASDSHTTFQLALPAVGLLSATVLNGHCSLHVVSAGGELLATFRSGPSVSDSVVWQAALAAAFPTVSSAS